MMNLIPLRVALTNSPNSGERMVSRALVAGGIKVQRSRLYASINLTELIQLVVNCEDTHQLIEKSMFQHPMHCGKYF